MAHFQCDVQSFQMSLFSSRTNVTSRSGSPMRRGYIFASVQHFWTILCDEYDEYCPSLSLHCPFTVPSLSRHCPITVPSLSQYYVEKCSAALRTSACAWHGNENDLPASSSLNRRETNPNTGSDWVLTKTKEKSVHPDSSPPSCDL